MLVGVVTSATEFGASGDNGVRQGDLVQSRLDEEFVICPNSDYCRNRQPSYSSQHVFLIC